MVDLTKRSEICLIRSYADSLLIGFFSQFRFQYATLAKVRYRHLKVTEY